MKYYTLELNEDQMNTLQSDLEFVRDIYEDTSDCDEGQSMRDTEELQEVISIQINT